MIWLGWNRATGNRHPRAMGALEEHQARGPTGLGPERRECWTPTGRRRAMSERRRTEVAHSP